MALISLNGKDTSEAFRLDDSAIIYVDTITGGSRLTISDNKVDTRNQLDVEETPAQIAALTTKLLQITNTNKSSNYINIDRVVEVKNSADADNNAVLVYDDNGDEYKQITINQTIAEFITSTNEVGAETYLEYLAIIAQSGENNPVLTVISNNLDQDITATRNSEGSYELKTPSGTPFGSSLSKIVCDIFPSVAYIGSENADATVYYNNSNSITIETFTSAGASDDILWGQQYISIKKYF